MLETLNPDSFLVRQRALRSEREAKLPQQVIPPAEQAHNVGPDGNGTVLLVPEDRATLEILGTCRLPRSWDHPEGFSATRMGPVPLEYSIEWLTCAVASRFNAVMVG